MSEFLTHEKSRCRGRAPFSPCDRASYKFRAFAAVLELPSDVGEWKD